MQKILRRTALAESQVARRLAKKKDAHLRLKEKTQRENDTYKANLANADIKRERQVRREDYELGPLAPRRDVGTMKDTYGTVHAIQMSGKRLTPKERVEQYPDTPRYINIVPEDRVVLLHGRDKGKIGKVTGVDNKTFEVTVEGLNLVRQT
jgi:large subunit ribosomal protein L24